MSKSRFFFQLADVIVDNGEELLIKGADVNPGLPTAYYFHQLL
jgi:hypothetical protein